MNRSDWSETVRLCAYQGDPVASPARKEEPRRGGAWRATVNRRLGLAKRAQKAIPAYELKSIGPFDGCFNWAHMLMPFANWSPSTCCDQHRCARQTVRAGGGMVPPGAP